MATRTVLVTPRGRAIYPHLTTPDTKFNADGTYSVKLAVRTVDAEKVIEAIDQAQEKALAIAVEENPKLKGKTVKEADLPYSTNAENEEETIFVFKMKAKGKTKKGEEFTQRPALFDAKGKPCPAGIKVGGGSVLRVSFEPAPFYTATVGAGVTLRLKAVQVLELREFGGGTADSYGFEQEDGFSAEDSQGTNEDQGQTEGNEDSSEKAAGDGSDF